MVFFFSGLAFKLSLVPFHFWTADTYQGAPSVVAGYLSVISKGAAAFAALTILTKVFANIITFWHPMLCIIIEVSNDGKFYYKDAAGNTIDMNRQIGVYQFTNPAGLEKDSGSLLVATAASGNPMNELTTPGLTRSKVCQNYLEASNSAINIFT